MVLSTGTAEVGQYGRMEVTERQEKDHIGRAGPPAPHDHHPHFAPPSSRYSGGRSFSHNARSNGSASVRWQPATKGATQSELSVRRCGVQRHEAAQVSHGVRGSSRCHLLRGAREE